MFAVFESSGKQDFWEVVFALVVYNVFLLHTATLNDGRDLVSPTSTTDTLLEESRDIDWSLVFIRTVKKSFSTRLSSVDITQVKVLVVFTLRHFTSFVVFPLTVS